MKKYFFFAVLGLTMMACTTESENVVEPVETRYTSSNKPTQDAIAEATRQMENILGDIYMNAYDESEGYLDPIAFEGIAAQRMGMTLAQVRQLEDMSEDVESHLTPEQQEVFDKIKEMLKGKCGITDEDVAYAESLCAELSQEEGEQIMAMVYGAQCLSRAINRKIKVMEAGPITRATVVSGEIQHQFEQVADFSVRAFACNVAAGVVGTIAGQMTTLALASGSSGPAGWAVGTGILVSWGVAALVSTVYC